MSYFTKKSIKSIPIIPLNDKKFDAWVKKQPKTIIEWIKNSEFKAKGESLLIIRDKDGNPEKVFFGVPEKMTTYSLASLPAKLPYHKEGYYIDAKFSAEDATKVSIGWILATYEFNQYKSGKKDKKVSPLVLPEKANKSKIEAVTEAFFLVRDLINTPANDMGPDELEKAAKKVAGRNPFKVIRDKDLIKKNYPAVFEVGKGSSRRPRLIDFTWGNAKHPKITLVGKGVCFDTGGLNLKPGNSMYLMKKDMGGAAHVLGLASIIMEMKLPVRLRVIIPAVENSISGDSYRPSDVIKTRKGLSVEVGDTDAEGRLILADALAEAASEKPKLIVDFATLTGAARVALGPDLPAMFTNDDTTAKKLETAAEASDDPLWRLPLWPAYKDMLKSDIADTNSVGNGGFAGAITAALFLENFVEKEIPWVHIDTFGWVPSPKPGKPKGGEALGMLAVYNMLEGMFKK